MLFNGPLLCHQGRLMLQAAEGRRSKGLVRGLCFLLFALGMAGWLWQGRLVLDTFWVLARWEGKGTLDGLGVGIIAVATFMISALILCVAAVLGALARRTPIWIRILPAIPPAVGIVIAFLTFVLALLQGLL